MTPSSHPANEKKIIELLSPPSKEYSFGINQRQQYENACIYQFTCIHLCVTPSKLCVLPSKCVF